MYDRKTCCASETERRLHGTLVGQIGGGKLLADGALPLPPFRVVHAVVPRVFLSYLILGGEEKHVKPGSQQ